MDSLDVLHQLLTRRTSCREFQDRDVPGGLIDSLLALGRRDDQGGWGQPSAHDLHGVTVDRVPATVSRVAIEAAVFDSQPWLLQAPELLSITADLDAVTAEFADQDADQVQTNQAQTHQTQTDQAQTGQVDTGPTRGRDFAMIEGGLLAQSVLLGCVALGLGSVVVAGVRQQALQHALATRRHVVALIAVGYPAGAG